MPASSRLVLSSGGLALSQQEMLQEIVDANQHGACAGFSVLFFVSPRLALLTHAPRIANSDVAMTPLAPIGGATGIHSGYADGLWGGESRASR